MRFQLKHVGVAAGCLLLAGHVALARAEGQPSGARPDTVDFHDGGPLWASGPPVIEAQNFSESVVDRQTRTLAIGETGSLELKNVSGDITCIAGSGATASVEIVRESRGRTDADARLGLSEVQAVVEHQADRATVSAVYPNNRRPSPYSVSIRYIVAVPAGTRVTASSVSGGVTVRNIKGDVIVTSVSGDIEIAGAARLSGAKSVSGNVTILDAASSGTLSAGAVSGDIRMDRVKAARLDAESVSGSVVATGIAAGGTHLKSVSGDITFGGTMIPGGRYEFQSHSGDVHVTREGDTGMDLQLSSFSGSFHTEPAVNINNSRGTFRSRIGDGSAIVAARTFSGDVTIIAR